MGRSLRSGLVGHEADDAALLERRDFRSCGLARRVVVEANTEWLRLSTDARLHPFRAQLLYQPLRIGLRVVRRELDGPDPPWCTLRRRARALGRPRPLRR